MNYQVDVIIVGDSKEGREIVKALASKTTFINIAFISREFKSFTTHDYLNVEYIKEEVVFTDYKNRLFGCYLKTGDRIYCTHLVIASGLAYKPLISNNNTVPNVYYNEYNIPKTAKNQPTAVLGNTNADVKFVLNVAKKYRHVYFCTKNLTIKDITPANTKKLNAAKNIVVLPNTSLQNFQVSDNGELKAIELDNYSTITCSAIYVKTESEPEVSFVSNKLIVKDENNKLITTNYAESTIVPKCFAIGNCATKYNKNMNSLMVTKILSDFNGG
jgi:thioredoxin reductase